MGESTDGIGPPDRGAADANAGQDADVRIDQVQTERTHTRAELSATLGAIEARLRPGYLGQQAKARATGTTVAQVQQLVRTASDFGTTVVQRIKRNPLPTVAAALVLGWLVLRRRRAV